MARKVFCLFTALLSLFPAITFAGKESASTKWVVYYGDALSAEEFRPYDLIVFDSIAHPRLRPLRNQGKTLLAYLSLGEIEKTHPKFDQFKAEGLLLEESPVWPGNYLIDIRNPKWAQYLIEDAIPRIFHKRFDGLMLDTLDSIIHAWQDDPQKYKGMDKAAVNLLEAIHMHYPHAKLMLNRSFELGESLLPHVDMLLVEGVFSRYNTKKGEGELRSEAEFLPVIERVKMLKQRKPGLEIYALDYWNPDDRSGVKEIYQLQREQGFHPYVSSPDLQQHTPEPVSHDSVKEKP